MRKFIIKETEETKDFCESLIGSIATLIEVIEEKIESGLTAPYYQEYFKCETLDGELLFLEDELQEVV